MEFEEWEPVKMKARFKVAMTFIGMLFVGFLLLLILYFFYDKFIIESKIFATGNLSINYTDGNTFKSKKLENLEFSITNSTENDILYAITLNNVRGKGTYTLNDSNEIKLESGFIVENALIKAGEKVSYSLKVTGTDLYGTVNVKEIEIENKTFSELLLENNSSKDEPKTKLGEAATENEGLIKCKDDYGTCYYFRGNVANNYISFAGLTWRIVKINGDGTIKIVLDNNLEVLGNYYAKDSESFAFDESVVKTQLDSFYDENLEEYKDYISIMDFCNDLTTNDNGVFLAYNRLTVDKIYSQSCLNEKYRGKIALLTLDEVIFAGASISDKNENFYLYNEELSQEYFTMTSAKNSGTYYPFVVKTDGTIITSTSGLLYRGIRPVINITGNCSITGSGQKSDPYKIELN